MRIAISAGHHPAAPGAAYEGFIEHREALVWQREVVRLLGADGVAVPPGVLRSKVAWINAHRPALAVEIHFNDAWIDRNGDGNRDHDENPGRGSETLHYPGSRAGLRLAQAIQAELAQVFPPDRGAKEGWYRMNPAFGPDYFLARTRCPAVIVEPDFVVNRDRLWDNQAAGCAAIARGIRNYLELTYAPDA